MEQHGRSAGHDSRQSSPLTPQPFIDAEHESDMESCATTVPETVMAEQVTKDVVKEAQSVGRPAPIDDTASTTKTPAVNGELPSGPATTNSNPLEAPGTATTADGADAAPAAHAHASDRANGDSIPSGEEQQAVASPNESKQLLNGDSGDHSANESQAVADASGGSDTDISRPGSVDQSKHDVGHVRTNSSAKKPSTFKSVSVTKNFLAKSAVSTPVTRPGDRAAPAVQPSTSAMLTAKPRLVAKLGTGNAPRTLGKVNGAGSGPDASKVWNKNQPVPPPPPKQFTDEELKQQYGIHLATRLQADEAGKEAKWADIDDDEDDWAPEAVQWMDGTKSSVAAAENLPPPAEETKTILKPEAPVETPKHAAAAATNAPKPSVTGGTKTILKPGAHSQPATGKSSLVLKGQPEKPTLVAKPSATEKKSPWAQLPPIEKVSPVQINPPPPQPLPPRFSQRDSYGYDTMPPPAKEIAPDDFNRSWRDDRGSRPELFNSQSGRYEPVNDMRRGSVRDAGFRQQPSVLQRPSQEGPAEPSAAFQTSRSSADMPTWGRRRNSSNVSGDQARRMSIDRRAPDMPRGPMTAERRESQSINGFDPSDPGAPRPLPFAQAASPNAVHAHPASPYGSVTSSGTHELPTPNAAPAENPVEVQKRLMADKIERARLKKQQEQEAEKKAEAERKERIAKRLAAMGPPPEPKSKVKEQSPSRAPQQSPQKDKAALASIQSPPKPPVPTADGEVAQYGMMKVHHAQPIKKASTIEPIAAVKVAEPAAGAPPGKAHTEIQMRAPPSLSQHSAQSFDTFTRDNDKYRQPIEQPNNLVHQSEGAISTGSKSQAPQAAWSPATAPQPRPWTSQVWGPPPTKERALGNGTFDSGYNRGQPRSGSQQQLPVQSTTSTAPIGLSLAPQPSASSQSANQLPSSQTMYTQSGSLPVVQAVAPSRPGPIAPPLAKGWGNFQDDIRKDDANMIVKARQDRERLGEAFRPEIRETYKDQRGQAQTTLHDKVAGNVAVVDGSIKKEDAVKHAHDGLSPQQSLTQSTPLQQAAGPRASRFFPRPTEVATQPTATSSKADSPPPPPETETHPAFTGDVSHPLVRLPRPSPVVRLPRPVTGSDTHAETAVSMPSRGQSLGARPLAMNPEWQARFNKLLEKPGSAGSVSLPASTVRVASANATAASLKPGALAPAALSKASLDVRGAIGPATVSLPNAPQTRTFADDRGKEVITRKGTEALFEDREFGSLPTVRLSKAPHLAANKPAASPPKDDPYPRFKRFENPFTIRRLEVFDIERLAQKIDVVVHIPNMHGAIIKSMPRKRRSPKINSQFKPKQSNMANGNASSGPKDRPRKPSQQGQGDRSTNSSRAASNTWGSNNRSTSPQQPTTWARRAAAPVH
ncbi:Nn.00g114230.m01.CDS01 [Neocucurbitaria sp. VM-36]